jgi:hypothetical protein
MMRKKADSDLNGIKDETYGGVARITAQQKCKKGEKEMKAPVFRGRSLTSFCQ